VSNARIEDFVEGRPDDAPVVLCPMPQTVPHEMLTPYENLGREMSWLEEVLDAMRLTLADSPLKCPQLSLSGSPLQDAIPTQIQP